jgi:hypothetical protein
MTDSGTDSIEVRADPDLGTMEKETVIRFANDQDRLRIHSEQASVVRWLLGNPDYEEKNRREHDGTVYATTGTLSLGALKLSGDRKQTTPSSVVGGYPGDDDE